ncbi:MAG: hypothetical protein ACTSRT_10120 [Promethearchaeota archaeon]
MSAVGLEEKIRLEAIEILKEDSASSGLKYSELRDKLVKKLQNKSIMQVRNSIWDLDKKKPNLVNKPSKGIFRHQKFSNISISVPDEREIKEENFYEAFALWFKGVDECVEARKLYLKENNYL